MTSRDDGSDEMTDVMDTPQLAGAYRDGYADAVDEVLGDVLELLADVKRGLRTLDEVIDELNWPDYWADVPDEYDDVERVTAICTDCGEDTLSTPEGDWYMVRDDVWAAAGMTASAEDAYLHRRCLEKRLGRRLTQGDYTNAPINHRLRLQAPAA